MEASSKNWKGSMEVAISSRGASGGLCTLWHSSFYDAVQIRNNQHWIYTELVCKRTGKHFQFLSIYAPTLYREKQYCCNFFFLFKTLSMLKAPSQQAISIQSWLRGKKGGSQVRDQFREKVEDLILDWDLVYIKPKKGKYTTNTRLGPDILQQGWTDSWFTVVFWWKDYTSHPTSQLQQRQIIGQYRSQCRKV